MERRLRLLLTGLAFAIALPWPAEGGPAERCRQKKNLAAGRLASCRQRTEGRYGTLGDAVRLAAALAKCDAAFTNRWSTAEVDAAGSCPTIGDAPPIRGVVAQHTTDVAVALAGGTPFDCPGELSACLGELAMCPIPCGPESSVPLKTGQTTCVDVANAPAPCPGTGMDGETQAGLERLYVDDGDGTIHDARTGLVWEKLTTASGIHQWNASYTWANAFAVKIAALNTPPCFAGHCDWRLPNVTELLSLALYDRTAPAIAPEFSAACVGGCGPTTCSCTEAGPHWTSTTAPFDGGMQAFIVDFLWGASSNRAKTNAFHVRAVRGGA